MDADIQQHHERKIAEGDAMARFLTSTEWKIVEERCRTKIASLDSLRNVENMKDILARRHAVRILEGWLDELHAIVDDGERSRQYVQVIDDGT